MNSKYVDRRTLRSAGIGGVVGALASAVPLVVLVAPLLGGGVAGYVDRRGPRSGAVAGALAGLVIGVLDLVVTGLLLAVRFGFGEFRAPVGAGGVPVEGLVLGAVLTLFALVAGAVVAAIGGLLGGILEADVGRGRIAGGPMAGADGAARGGDRSAARGRRTLVVAASVIGGALAFVLVGVGVTAVLDPYIWPSALVGLPAGILAGLAVAVLGYHALTRSRTGHGPGETPGAQ